MVILKERKLLKKRLDMDKDFKRANMKRDRVLVIDLELNCAADKAEHDRISEIYEIGVAEFDMVTRTLIKKKSYFTKLQIAELTEYAENLSQITKEEVNSKARHFSEVCNKIRKDFATKNKVVLGWGADKEAILRECERKNATYPFSQEYWDLSLLASFVYQDKTKVSVAKALAHQEMKHKGTKHRGDDDAETEGLWFLDILNKISNS